jgi:hypothetical protein
MTKTKDEGIPPGFWIGLVLLVFLFLGVKKCTAKSVYDTIPCRNECIQKFAYKQTKNGNKVYAVYTDEKNNILDFIPVSESVYNYIMLCKENKIAPQLGIKLRDGEIYSIIKLKRRYVKANIK